MMISPESYYEEYLKEKNPTELLTAIRGLKNEIGHLKNIMEHPDYPDEIKMCPSESTRLWCTRLYLERAKQALAEMGGIYVPSKAELKAVEFDDNISFIRQFIFSIGGYFDGYETHTITLTDENLLHDVEHSIMLKPSNFKIPPNYPCGKDEFLEEIRELHMGEWRKNYNPERFGYTVLDGTQWEIKIEYNNGHRPVKFSGSNAYPYNFEKLEELFNIDEEQ